MTTTITRSTADCHTIHTPHAGDGSAHTWAVICLAAPGRLLIYSEYGSWAYSWSHPGEDFRRFICGLEPEYLIGKLAPGRTHLNVDRTVARIKELIAERVASGKMTELAAKDATEYIEAKVDVYHGWPDVFLHEVVVHPPSCLFWLYQYAAAGDLGVYEHDPACAEFVAKVWPVFVAELNKEVEG